MRTLIDSSRLAEGIQAWAEQVRAYYQERPLTLLGVQIGSVLLLGDLIRRLDMPLRVGMILDRPDVRQASRPGPLVIDVDVLAPLVRGRHVLLVDDLFVTGKTFYDLVPQIDDLGPAGVRSAVLLRKQGRCQFSIQPDFVAFDVPDVFVVGYGLDYQDRHRHLPYIAALDPEEMRGEGPNP